MTAEVSRRRLLQVVAAAVVAMPLTDLPLPRAAASGELSADAETATLEAWSDTMVPGQKRWPGDRAVAGATSGPGAVQAGAVDLMRFDAVGLGPALPGLAAALNVEASRYAAAAGLPLDPATPPFVGLSFPDRTALALELLDGTREDQVAWYALAAVAMLAFHTAAHLDTADAVRTGHPGLAWLRFPAPDADGLWRYPDFSYRRKLARTHPRTTRSGHPA
ncbi:MAG TPA: DUF5987 family protein [Nocardioidaceae bacterium]